MFFQENLPDSAASSFASSSPSFEENTDVRLRWDKNEAKLVDKSRQSKSRQSIITTI